MREREKVDRIENVLLAARRPPPEHEPSPGWQDSVMRDVRRIASPEEREPWTDLIEAPMRWAVPVCAVALVLLLGLNLYWNRTPELNRLDLILANPAAPPLIREIGIRSIL